MHLNKRQVEHRQRIVDTFSKLYPPKFNKGAAEHPDSELEDMKPLDLAYNILEEGLDTVAYAVTLIEQLEMQEE